MKLLFNHANKGKTEIKEILGFLDGGFTYKNLEPDIILTTPYLIDLTGQQVYDKLYSFYKEQTTGLDAAQTEIHSNAVKYSQIYVLSMAYLDYAPDNDLNHTNAGRTFSAEDNQKIPWEWQVQASNASIKRRAYKALDLLMALLDSSEWTEWTTSDQYKTANATLIKNTLEFDKVFPIDKSGQLFYRLVPFMADFEEESICAILTKTTYDTLKGKSDPTDQEKRILLLAKKAIAYLSLGKALKAFPVEMMPAGLSYHENTTQKGKARAEVMQLMNAEGDKYLLKLEYEHQQQNATYEAIDPMQGLDECSKHVSL